MIFHPPWPPVWNQRLEFLETAGRRWWPILGGVYAVRAVKRVSTLTPVRLRWAKQRSLVRGRAVEPTAQGGSGV